MHVLRFTRSSGLRVMSESDYVDYIFVNFTFEKKWENMFRVQTNFADEDFDYADIWGCSKCTNRYTKYTVINIGEQVQFVVWARKSVC